ncbi:response regulator [uncultured Desulfosarcina sp.]|uniref:response regulator n=1 Tax=uncultured Desulfosarcina sp. TaxID=218289 RepID=UPI0029C88B2E|nr:response regulator [uncultured Desulfosarcina sp.]
MRKILIVDDESHLSQELRCMLGAMCNDWNIDYSNNGPDALRRLESEDVDVIVSEMRMSGMDGKELLTQVREKYPEMVRIVLSAFSDHKAIMRTVRLAHQYISKPCDAEILKTMIERAFALKTLLKNQKLRQLIIRMEAFPGLPATYARITELLHDPEIPIQSVGKVIAEDIGMTVKILQLVNSAYYGIARRVAGPEEAVVFLGLDTIRALVLTIGLFSGFEESGIPKPMVEDIYRHSLKTGTLAKAIAIKEKMHKDQVEEAFMAGLLHDLGKLVMVHNMPDHYGELLQATLDKNLPIQDTEMKIFGATHELIGAYLIGLWGLPDSIMEAVAFHHCPGQCPTAAFDALGAVHVADAMAHVNPQFGGDIHGNRLSMEYLERFGLTDHLDGWIDLALESFE